MTGPVDGVWQDAHLGNAIPLAELLKRKRVAAHVGGDRDEVVALKALVAGLSYPETSGERKQEGFSAMDGENESGEDEVRTPRRG